MRRVVRLSKMFCKSRLGWVNMPGGLIQSVVADEVYTDGYERIDEIFYYTMKAVQKRLKNSVDVFNPTDNSISLLSSKHHYDEIDNWLTRLSDKLSRLDILFDKDCNEVDAYNAWSDFFNHSFWQNIALTANESYSRDISTSTIIYNDTEEFIEEHVCAINDIYNLSVDIKVEANGFGLQPLHVFLKRFPMFHKLIPRGLSINFYASTDCPHPYDIWWKVRNVGRYAEEHNKVRGNILKKFGKHHKENSQFGGPHFVECYIIKNNECVAMKRVHVNIGDASYKHS